MPPTADVQRDYRKQQQHRPPWHQQQPRPPGGALPEGWQFFRPYNSPVWCGIECSLKDSPPGEDRGLLVFGLLPIKCPLDVVFDKTLKQAEMRQSQAEDEDLSEEESLSLQTSSTSSAQGARREKIKISERDRTSTPRYYERVPAEALNEYFRSPIFTVRSVLNLCATDRYYDPAQVKAKGIEFNKFFFEGGGKVLSPSKAEKLVSSLMQACFRIGRVYKRAPLSDLPSIVQSEQQAGRQLPVLAMHCTHGVNRTGYCMLMFLFCLGLESVDAGLDIFRTSRGHDINKTDFENHLRDIWEYEDPAYERVRSYRDIYRRSTFFL